jgi:peroxiredoxin
MVATVCLFTCALAITQPGSGQLVCRLVRGQELVYSGSFTEEATGQNVQLQNSYRLESRLFVLDATPQGAEVALLTILKQRSARSRGVDAGLPEICSVHLDLVRVDPQGRTVPPATVLPEGPAASEFGAFVEFSRGRVGPGQKWDVAETGRPPHTWRYAGTETVNGTPCIKLVGVQQSDDWDQPRADQTAWRRLDTAWVAPNLGIAQQFERTLELREPARQQPTHRTVTRYSLDSRMAYPGLLYEDRRREIRLTQELADRMKPLLREPEKAGPRPFDEALARIAYHVDNQPATPYREALNQFKRRLEAARRGEAPPAEHTPAAAPVNAVLAVGKPAPDFVVPNLNTHESARLRRFLGRPVLLVFYSPTSSSARDILHFAQSLADPKQSGVNVIGLAVSDDTDRILKQRDEWKLTFPLLSGQGLHLTYAVEATPKFVVLDAAGVARGVYVGWGREMPRILTDELSHWKRP